MIRHLFTRFSTAIALVCASVAWSAWAYLHTVADPHRIEAVATAVLADPDARLELAEPLAEQVVTLTGLDPVSETEVRDAVVAVMADQRIAANLTSAVGAAHARSFGVSDPRSATIDGALLVAAVRDHLATANPTLAAQVPADLVGEITVPERRLPFASGLRTLASTLVAWCGAAAIGLLTFSFLAGDRARTLRRFGYWAISAGLAWALGPRLVVLAARRFFPAIDATLAAGVGAATRTVTIVATVLVAIGIGALVGARALRMVASRTPRGPAPVRSVPSAPRRPSEAPPSRAPAPAPHPLDVPAVTMLPPKPTIAPTRTLAPVAADAPTTDVAAIAFEPSMPTTVLPVVTPPEGAAPAGAAPVRVVAGDLPLSVPVLPPAPEVDPWALFGGPAIDPATGEALPRRPEP